MQQKEHGCRFPWLVSVFLQAQFHPCGKKTVTLLDVVLLCLLNETPHVKGPGVVLGTAGCPELEYLL